MKNCTTPTQILNAAADYIEEHGWTQGSYCDIESGAVCAVGAIRMVSAPDASPFWYPPSSKAETAIEILVDHLTLEPNWTRLDSADDPDATSSDIFNEAVWAWNDLIDQTAEDVIRKMRTAAEIASDDAANNVSV